LAVPSIDEDRQLIDSILVGDQHAWEKIVQRFSGMVWRILRGRFHLAQDEAEDAFQEIFLGLQKHDFRRIRQWRGQAPLDAYIVVVVSRLAQDVMRKEHGGPIRVVDMEGEEGNKVDPPDPGPDPLEVAELAERRHAVNTCRERLAPRDQELFKLRHDEDLAYRLIGKRLKMTVNNVGVALSRAEERLRQCLKQHFQELFSGWGDPSQASV
jgi:RNA polymerase sigma factor (sigma-70 family)